MCHEHTSRCNTWEKIGNRLNNHRENRDGENKIGPSSINKVVPGKDLDTYPSSIFYKKISKESRIVFMQREYWDSHILLPFWIFKFLQTLSICYQANVK
jgi:hypothetical protein